MQFPQASIIEASAGVANVNELTVFVHAQNNAAKKFARTARLGVTANNGFLAIVSFYLQPRFSPYARQVMALFVFSHNSFQALFSSDFEQSLPLFFDVIA